MADTLRSRAKHAWNIFFNIKEDEPKILPPTERFGVSVGSYARNDRPRYTRGNERSIVSAIYNRIALDVAAINIKHVKVDENGRYTELVKSKLNECLTLEANIDQTARQLRQDAVASMFDEGVIAIVPVDTTDDPNDTSSYDIETMRIGKIIEWYPRAVKVNLYNDRTGHREDVICSKENVAIVENPLYAVINEPNSTMQRLIRKLNLLDYIDEQTGKAPLNLIIQVPYAIKGERKQEMAEARRKAIVDQLQDSEYGIAYVDSTEKVIQLNRSLDNNLLKQIEYLTTMLYSQLGLTQAIMEGTADEKAMLNYTNRTVEPIVSAIVEEMQRKFLTKTARSQGQSIMFFRDPFKLVPVDSIAEIADKFTRNEIMTPNEIRQIIGMVPAQDPEADELRNRNISEASADVNEKIDVTEEEVNNQNG